MGVAGGSTLEIGGPVTVNANLNVTMSGMIQLDSTLNVAGGGSLLQQNGAFIGAGNLVKNGLGTVILAGNNSYSGTTSVSGGTLQIGNGGGTGNLGSGPVSLATNAALVFNRNDSGLVVANRIGGNGSVAQVGLGVTTLSGGNTYGGGTTISAGTVVADNASALGSGGVTVSGGTLDASLLPVSVGSLTITSGGLNLSLGNTLTSSGRRQPGRQSERFRRRRSGRLQVARLRNRVAGALPARRA